MIREGSGVKGTFGRKVKGTIASSLNFHFFKLQKWFILKPQTDGEDVFQALSFMNLPIKRLLERSFFAG